MLKQLLVIGTLWGLIYASESIIPDAERIRQARLYQNEAMAKGDVEKTASFWTEDITLRRGLGDSIIGKQAYRALLNPSPTEESIIYVREPTEIEISPHWPLAYESGTWRAKKGLLEIMTGRYSAQWVKRNEEWLIRSEVFVALTCTDLSYHFPSLP